MTPEEQLGSTLLILIAICGFLFWIMIRGAIKTAMYIKKEAFWTWNKNTEEIHIYFFEKDETTKIPNVFNIDQAREIMADKNFAYMGSDEQLQEN